MQTEIADRVVDLRAAVNRRVLRVREVYQIDAVLLRVHRPHLGPLLAIVYHDLIVLRARDQGVAVRREVDAVYPIRVLAEDLRHLEAPHHVVDELHGDGRRVLPLVPSP